MKQGLDLLAGAAFKTYFAEYSTKYAVGIFAESFGDAYSTVEAALKKGGKTIRIQLIWSDSHSFGDKDIPKIKKLAEKYNSLAVRYSDAKIYLSPFCEHNVSSPDKYLDICHEAAPNCEVVNTPWKGGFSKKYINEIHGDHAKPSGKYFYSFDGTEVTNSDVESYKKKHKDAEIFFMWTARFNLKWSEKDKATRPTRLKEARERKPSKDMLEGVSYLFSDKGTYTIPKSYLIKPFAEKHDKSDTKGDKLLIISPVKAVKIILKKGGEIVATLPIYGAYQGGGWRYYWNRFAYTLGPAVEVWVNDKKVGTINPGFRSPPYR